MPSKEYILKLLKDIKPEYEKEGFVICGLFGSYATDSATIKSDIDILIETSQKFVELNGGGFGAIARFEDIRKQLEERFGVAVDLTDKSGLGLVGEKFIIDRALYVQ